MTITELAIKRPTLVVVLFSFLGVLGIYGFGQLKYDLMPKMTIPVITITTIYPGTSPNEMETSVTKIIEDAISGMEKVASIHSISQEGVSTIVVELDPDANVDLSIEDAQRKVNQIVQNLPRDAQKSQLSKIAFDELPVIRMAASSKMPSREFYQFIKDKIQPRLSKIQGVGIIALFGGEEREIKVNVDQQKLKSYNMSLSQVANAVKAANLDLPTGNIHQAQEQFVVRIAGKFRDADELKNFVIAKSKQNTDIRLSDVADVEDGITEIKNIYRLNGSEAIGITVQKSSDANTVEVCNIVKKEVKNLEKEFSDIGLKFDIAQDGSVFILDSANAVKKDLGLAILLVALVMLLFLHSFRNSLIVMVAIPSSLVSAFFLMYIFNFTLNLMTLLAMSLVIGILVDDSIVVLENIYRHLEMKKSQVQSAIDGRNEIGFAALSITLVDVVVFVPLAMISGIIGDFLREYALVVVFSTLMSLLVSFTITPMLASMFTKLEHLTKKTLMGRFTLWFEGKFNKLTDTYSRILHWGLNNRWKIITLSLVIFLSSLLLPILGFIGFEFMPNVDRGEIVVSIEVAPGTRVEQTNFYVQNIEKILSGMPEVRNVLSNVGYNSLGIMGFLNPSTAELYVLLVDKNQRNESTDAIGLRIKKYVQSIPGMKVHVDPVGMMGSQNSAPINLMISGTTHEDTYNGAEIIKRIVENVEGTTDVRLSSEEGKPELKIEMDRDQLSNFGLSLMDIGNNLRIALTGDDDSKYRDPKDLTQYILRVNLDKFDRSKLETIENLAFMNNKGQMIQLKQFAKVTQSLGPTQLERYNRISSIALFSQVYGKTSGIVSSDIKKKLESVKLPPGVTYEFVGQQKYMIQSMLDLLWAMFAGILFVYMIMIALYNSYSYPFVVLFSIPVAIVGAMYGLGITGKSLSIYSMLGVIMLIGLVAKNAILLVDRSNQMKLEGYSSFDALIEAGRTRLRPILMTTFAMIMGMMPIALSTSAGSEAKSGLAVVLIGGLTSSLLLTLVLVPVIYYRFDLWKASLAKLFHRKPKSEILEAEG